MKLDVSRRRGFASFTPEALGLVDVDAPPEFEAITRLAMRLFRVPVALISIVQEDLDRQYFLSQQGLCQPWSGRCQTPLSHSFCQHVKRSGKPMVVRDARTDPRVSDNGAIEALGVSAYLGVPIVMPDGAAVGALCVIDCKTRNWTDDDLDALSDLASCVNDEILLRAALKSSDHARRRSERYGAMRESVAMAFMAPDLPMEARFEGLLQAGCTAFGMMSGRISRLNNGSAQTLFEHRDPVLLGEGMAPGWSCALTRMVASECRVVHFSDLAHGSPAPGKHGAYIGAPLILNAVLHGVIEFVGARPPEESWCDDDLAVLSIMSMLATTQFGMLDQISTLQRSEAALLRHLSEMKRTTA